MPKSPQFLLTVDVGNSRIKCGLFDHVVRDADAAELPRCLFSAAVPIDGHLPWDAIQHCVAGDHGRMVAGIIAGVNPAGVARVLENWPGNGWPSPLVIDEPQRLPLQVNLPAAGEVGIDRLLNAVAGNAVRPTSRPAIIVDTGTATTIDYLSAAGVFEGGAILPGFELSARALHQYTALLPLIDVETLGDVPPQPLGRGSHEALRSGLFWGQLGAVKELIDRMSQSVDSDLDQSNHHTSETKSEIRNRGTRTRGSSEIEPPFLLLTGGGSILLKPHLPSANWEPQLGLQGLALIATELNQ
jgi:type III pantothenate kinase